MLGKLEVFTVSFFDARKSRRPVKSCELIQFMLKMSSGDWKVLQKRLSVQG